jgi:hypothetical protein
LISDDLISHSTLIACLKVALAEGCRTSPAIGGKELFPQSIVLLYWRPSCNTIITRRPTMGVVEWGFRKGNTRKESREKIHKNSLVDSTIARK